MLDTLMADGAITKEQAGRIQSFMQQNMQDCLTGQGAMMGMKGRATGN